MRWLVLPLVVALVLALAVGSYGVAARDYELCDNVRFKDRRIRLNSNEKILVCGSDKGGPGWKSVPLSQAEYHMKVFLQHEGYFTPTFERHGSQLWVWPGPRTEVAKLEIRADTSGVLDADRVRHVEGDPLTTEMLDNVTKWADVELRSNGYACPKVDVKAQAWDRTVVVTPQPGIRGRIRGVTWEGRDNLHENVLRRYAATEAGEVYDLRRAQLTANRLFADGLFETALVQADCHGDQVDLKVRTSVGRPRLLRFGFGASTEEWPFVDVSFKNSRLDAAASSFYTLMHASPRVQSLSAGSDLFLFRFSPTVFLGPRFKVARRSERAFEESTAKTGADLGRYFDEFGLRWIVRGGPTVNHVDTVRGIGPTDYQYLNWEASLAFATHHYELYARDQYEGFTGRLDYSGQRDEFGSQLNVDRYEANLKYLWNINSYTPPLFVLATRVSGVAVNANPIDLSSRRDQLPLEYRIFWGGGDNMRGFARQRLNNRNLGYLTGLYGGVELRLIEELPWRLQPLLLWDIARLGTRRWTTDEPIYQSWGYGLRWASPIGTLRGSAAKGEISNGDSTTVSYEREWVYFLSFGQEF